MIAVEQNSLHCFLAKHDEKTWIHILANLIPSIHPVDQIATQIWFSFWPLKLSQSLEQCADPAQTTKKMQLDGKYRLDEQIDSSVEFLFGSRYWPEIKKTVLLYTRTSTDLERMGLEKLIRDMASSLAAERKVSVSILLGITAIACMILQQVGIAAFAPAAKTRGPSTRESLTAEQALKRRIEATQRGFFGFLRAVDRKYTITFDENRKECSFQAIRAQDLSMACATDKRDYQSQDHRRIEGPIPCQCRSGACGYCWIGVLSGKDKLSEITEFEKKRLKYFGYASSDSDGETHPPIRLSCQSKCYGDISIVVPPWNGVLDGR